MLPLCGKILFIKLATLLGLLPIMEGRVQLSTTAGDNRRLKRCFSTAYMSCRLDESTTSLGVFIVFSFVATLGIASHGHSLLVNFDGKTLRKDTQQFNICEK